MFICCFVILRTNLASVGSGKLIAAFLSSLFLKVCFCSLVF